MGSYVPPYTPFDRSHLSYYEKAPYDEDETLQPSSMGDISEDFVEDLARIIAGLDQGRAPAHASDIFVKNGKGLQSSGQAYTANDESQMVVIKRYRKQPLIIYQTGTVYV